MIISISTLKKIGVAMLIAGVTAAAQEGLKHLTNVQIKIDVGPDKE